MIDYNIAPTIELENDPHILLEEEAHAKEFRVIPTTKKEIADTYDTLNKEKLIANKKVHDAVIRLRRLRDSIDELQLYQKELEDCIATYMQDRECLITVDGEELVNWRFSKPSKKFNDKLFRVENEALYAKYLEEKPGNRTFLLKNRGE